MLNAVLCLLQSSAIHLIFFKVKLFTLLCKVISQCAEISFFHEYFNPNHKIFLKLSSIIFDCLTWQSSKWRWKQKSSQKKSDAPHSCSLLIWTRLLFNKITINFILYWHSWYVKAPRLQDILCASHKCRHKEAVSKTRCLKVHNMRGW